MVRRKKAKTASLVLTGLILLLQCFDVSVNAVGLCGGSSISTRMLYSFFHANFFHAVFNCWCMLSVVFAYDISLVGLLTAYAIACTFPVDMVSPRALPTIGLSGVCYALMGRVAFSVSLKWEYRLYILSYLTVGFLFPAFNGWLHLYCYIVGLFVGYLNKPVR